MTLSVVSSNLTPTLIKNRAGLNLLANEWNTLLRQSAADSIFLTWEWVTSWLDTVSPAETLAVVAVRDSGGRLVAVAPFYISILHFFGIVKYRCLRIIGDCYTGGEYPDIIVLPGIEDTALAAIATTIASSACQWDCAWLPNVAGWTGAMERLLSALGHGFVRKRPCSFSALTLPSTWQEFACQLSRNRRSILQRQKKRLVQAGIMTTQLCRSKDHLLQALDTLFALHQKRWRESGQEGSFVRRPRMVDFYKDFAPKALANNWLVLYSLVVDSVPIAAQYGYRYKSTFLQLQEGYDPAGPKGSGNTLRAEIFRWCIEQGIREYDFLGEHTPHKSYWCAVERWGWQIFLVRNKVKNLPLKRLKIWPTGRFLRQTLSV